MKLNFKILSAIIMSALTFLSIGDGFAMNQAPNIMENHSYKEQSVLKKITEQTQKSQSMTLDEAICSEFTSGDFCGCQTLGEKWNVIMSLYPKIKAGNPYGRSALGQAISSGRLDLTKYLVKNGASTTDMDGSKRTAVMRAIQYNHPDIAVYLGIVTLGLKRDGQQIQNFC